MKILLFIFLLTLTNAVLSQSSPTQTKTPISDDEYEIYSAFINQIYLADFINDWFDIQGKKFRRFENLNKFEEVVIFADMVPDFTNGSSMLSNYPFKSQIPEDLLKDFLARNDNFDRLEDKFTINVKHTLISQEEMNSYLSEAQKRNIQFETLYRERFPGTRGSISFYRVGFDELHTRALLAAVIWPGGYHLALLTKKNGSWGVDKVFPEDKSLRIDLKNCEPVSKGSWLALGSTSVRVIGRKKNSCHIQEFYEIEGGYSETNCFVPVALGQLTVDRGEKSFLYSRNLHRYCRRPRHGNVFLDAFRRSRRKQ